MLRRVVPRRLQALILMLAVGLTTLFLLSSPGTHHGPANAILNHPYFRYNLTAEEPEEAEQECVFPRVHPFHPSVWGYIREPRPIHCRVRSPVLTYVNQFGRLSLNWTELAIAGYKIQGGGVMQTLHCYWKPVIRGEGEKPDDDQITYGKEVELSLDEGALLSEDDVVSVTCRNFAGFSVYDAIHAHIRSVRPIIHRPRRIKQPINVLIFGLDSLSRLAFIRLLPNTYRYLTETLSMRVFRGMNKVADNTYPNLVALLTGKEAYGGELPDQSLGFDKWPLLWKNFTDAGFATLWAEDFPDFGLFNYLAKGFRFPPTQHYLRPFWLAVKNSGMLRTSSHMCFGPTPKHILQMDYLKRFVLRYSNGVNGTRGSKGADGEIVPFFGFSFLAELSHEYLSQVAAADDDFMQFFQFLHEGKHLKNTLLIVMSDHGHRFDAIRSTEVGRIEERLPFFAMHVPSSLTSGDSDVEKHLKTNKGRLLTPYDTHATLIDLLGHITTGRLLGSISPSGYGRSLFGTIPASRTCKDAGIPPHYCICESETTISTDDPRVRAAVRVLFHRINAMLRVVRQFCVELLPGTVKSAYMVNGVLVDVAKLRTHKVKIRVAVEAEPSKGIFEATVEVKTPQLSEKLKSTPPMNAKVLGDISRINKYGNQSACIRHDILRKYCFCQQTTPRTNKLTALSNQRTTRHFVRNSSPF